MSSNGTEADITGTRSGIKRPNDNAAFEPPTKRAASTAPEDEDSSDDDLGPALPSTTAPKKRRTLKHEALYLSNLPTQSRYYKSFMHRDTVSHVTWTPTTDFLITTSNDGVVKFWKKAAFGIEFVKMFKSHAGGIVAVSASADGRSYATAGDDKTVKLFDVITFDVLAVLNIQYSITSICWVHKTGSSLPLLAVSDELNQISIYDGRGENPEPLHVLKSLHRAPVSLMAYNNKFDCVVSADTNGMVEYWRPHGDYEKPKEVFDYKTSTNLFDFKKARSVPTSLTLSPSGNQFSTFSIPDRQIRIFDFASAKLLRTYDESIDTQTTMQQAGTALHKLEDLDFGRRLAVEREIDASAALRSKCNVIFDESENFIIYAGLLGIKTVNIVTNRVVRLWGKDESGMGRATQIALYQGAPKRKNVVTLDMAASANPLLQEAEQRDPILVCAAVNKQRFYLFNSDDDISKAERDVFNEKPTKDAKSQSSIETKPSQSGNAAVIHTTMGDIQVRLFPEAAPRSVENFVTHSKNGYYNGVLFHRVIPKFMIQTGDPLGDGTGGESIWGREFEDEFSTLRHDKPFTLSMANAGPNTNGSQFFITVEKTPWLDNKHTIFGRAVSGLDVITKISQVRTLKDKPVQDISIVNISIT